MRDIEKKLNEIALVSIFPIQPVIATTITIYCEEFLYPTLLFPLLVARYFKHGATGMALSPLPIVCLPVMSKRQIL